MCKHVLAARFVQERDNGGKAPPLDTDTVPKRPTFKQNWEAYNEAQTTEKYRLWELLVGLCRGIEEPPPPKTGRRPHLYRDALFAMTLKVYCGFSSRRFHSDLADAHAKGYLTRPIPGMKVNKFFETDAFVRTLKNLITQSALPLRTIETTFVPDSSGFSTSRFVRWYGEKYGVQRSGYDWAKVHIMTGTTTGTVTAVEIEHRDAADCPQFKPLVEKTAEHFAVKEVPAEGVPVTRQPRSSREARRHGVHPL